MLTLEDCKYLGAMAFAEGRPMSACPYHREDRCAAWESGWLREQERARERESPLTPEEKARGRLAIAAVRAALGAETTKTMKGTAVHEIRHADGMIERDYSRQRSKG